MRVRGRQRDLAQFDLHFIRLTKLCSSIKSHDKIIISRIEAKFVSKIMNITALDLT